MSKQVVELFVANCPLCEDARAKLAELACDACEVIVHDLAAGCDTGECLTKAETYGVSSVPAVVVNGRLADCCAGRGIDEQRLRDLGIGAAA